MRINVRQVDGSFAVLDVDPTSSFGDLKALISSVSGIEASELTIVCGGATASDEQRLLDACVTEHTALTIVTAFGGVIEDLQSQLSAKAMLPSGGDVSERPLLEAGALRRQQGRDLAEANAAAAAGIREQVADVTRAMARGLASTAAAMSSSPAESVFALAAMAEDDLLPADAVAVMDAIPGLHLLLPCGACKHIVLQRGATATAPSTVSGSAAAVVTLGEEQPIAALRKAAAAASELPVPNTALLLRRRAVPHAFDAGVSIGQLGLSPDGSTVLHVVWQPAPLADSAALLAVSEARPRAAALQAAAQAFGLSSSSDAHAPQAGQGLATSDEGLLQPSCAYGNTPGGRLHAHCACCGVAGAHMAAVPLCPCCLSEAATPEPADAAAASRTAATAAAAAGASSALSVVITRGTLPPGDGDGVDAGAAQAAGGYSWGALLALRIACARCGYTGPAEVGFACRAVTVATAGAAAAAPGASSGGGGGSSRAYPSDLDVPEGELLLAAAAAVAGPASAAGPRIRRCPSKPVTLSALLPAQGPSALARDLSLPPAAGTQAAAAGGPAAPVSLDAGVAASLVGGSAGSAALAEEDPLGVADGRAGGGLALGGAGATADPSLCALGTDEASRALRLTAQVQALLSFPLGGAGVDEVAHLPLAVRPTD